ncbi:MAG: hypothetical protein EXQ69_03280 [Acidimicrobiia bacterium]|nr:hypothetical protein [Acidimicrobiia bacterium]
MGEWIPTVLLQTLLPIALVISAALVIDRVVRLVAIGSFALGWLVGFAVSGWRVVVLLFL